MVSFTFNVLSGEVKTAALIPPISLPFDLKLTQFTYLTCQTVKIYSKHITFLFFFCGKLIHQQLCQSSKNNKKDTYNIIMF